MIENYRKTRKTHSRGTRSAQPAASDVLEGTLYFVTDEGIIEQSNGVSWVSYSGTGGSSSIANNSILIPSIDGEDGFDGFPGLKGNDGATGAAGVSGAQGPRGYSGLDGLDGESIETMLLGSSSNEIFIEKGNWTPFDASGASLTFTLVTGTYVRLGPVVFVRWTLRYPITANGANCAIGGLPYQINGEIAFTPGFGNPAVAIYLFGASGTTIINPTTQAGGANLINSQASNSWIDGSGFYFT